jgi:hypothetical protein
MVLLYSFSVGSSAAAKATDTVGIGEGKQNRQGWGKQGRLQAEGSGERWNSVGRRIELVPVFLMVLGCVAAGRCS